MQSIILAAGSSTRTYPLTITRPKPLLKVANKTILEHNIESLRNVSEEIIVVVGYKKEMMEGFAKENFSGLNVKFIEQKEQLGTGHALSILERRVKGRFILLMGDNIYSKKDINEIAKHKYAILVTKVKNPELFGVITEKNGLVKDITEKPKNHASNLVSCALYSLDEKIFEILKKVKRSERNEYELPDAVRELAINGKVYCINSSSCLQISYPWDLLAADKELRKSTKIKDFRDTENLQDFHVNKNLIGKNTKILGKVENSSIGDNCEISGSVRGSIIMDHSIIGEGSIVEDSVIGENVYFKGMAKSLSNAVSIIKGKPVNAGKLGTIIGDNVKAENVIVKPGCKIWPNKTIKGWIKNDIY